MALHDRDVYVDDGVRHRRTVGGGDSPSAIRHAQKPIRDEMALPSTSLLKASIRSTATTTMKRGGTASPATVKRLCKKLACCRTYRNAESRRSPFDHHLERRVRAEDWQYAGWTPRRTLLARAGANPMHGRNRKGAVVFVDVGGETAVYLRQRRYFVLPF